MADAANTPVYTSYKTFQNGIRGLVSEGELPSHIDRSLLLSMGGSTRNQFMGALKFLQLIEDDGAPTQRMKDLAQADDTTWKKLMKELLVEFYPNQVAVLGAGTINKLRESFGEELQGTQVVVPAMRFLIAAASDSGVKVSPHILKGVPSAKRPSRPRGSGVENGDDETGEQEDEKPKVNSMQAALLEKFPAFDPSWSPEQQKTWFTTYEKLLAMSSGKEVKND